MHCCRFSLWIGGEGGREGEGGGGDTTGNETRRALVWIAASEAFVRSPIREIQHAAPPHRQLLPEPTRVTVNGHCTHGTHDTVLASSDVLR